MTKQEILDEFDDINYVYNNSSKHETLSWMLDELLEEQEPVLLKNQHKPGGHFINANSPWISRCPKCGKKIEGRQTRFCKYCGQAVKWDA